MPSATTTSTAIHHHHHHHRHHPPQQQYPSSLGSSSSSLISTRPILPLPKRRVASIASSSSRTTSSTTALPLSLPQIFSHTYPPSTSSTKTTPSYIQHGDYETSDSEDDGDDAGSTVSSVGREDFNLKNKKKRKIPLSATSTGNVCAAITDVGSPISIITRTGSLKGRLSGWRIPSATVRTDGGYLRRKTRVSSRSSEVEEFKQESIDGDLTGEKTSEEAHASEPTSPAPSGPFSFTCPSPLALPIVPPAPPVATTSQRTYPVPSAPPTTPLPVPPPPPVAQGQENIPPQQPHPQSQQQQSPAQQPPPQTQRPPLQGMKHPNSEKARRVAQLTKLRERYRTGPKPETDEIYICQFCTYGFIYGEDPVYLVRQYNRKRNAEMRLRRERRKMLEKARLKGKKGQAISKSNTGGGGGGGNDEEIEDDGLCCTCGQKVGQHNHVPTGGTQPQPQPQPQPQGVGQGPGKGK